MAIPMSPIAVVFRPFVEQEISRSGWISLVHHASKGPSVFDGELMAAHFMSTEDGEDFVSELTLCGFRMSEDGAITDIHVHCFGKTFPEPVWLREIEVRSLTDEPLEASAWTMRVSDVFTIYLGGQLLTKGYEVDWPPYMGRIT